MVADVVVTVPMGQWVDWIEEGDLPGDAPTGNRSHFWVGLVPTAQPGDRVYVVAHGRLRGYAPLVGAEVECSLRPDRACLLRDGGAVAVTIDQPIRGFQGWRYRWWERADERPYPDWQVP